MSYFFLYSSRKSALLMKCCPMVKRENYMTDMDCRVSKKGEGQEEVRNLTTCQLMQLFFISTSEIVFVWFRFWSGYVWRSVWWIIWRHGIWGYGWWKRRATKKTKRGRYLPPTQVIEWPFNWKCHGAVLCFVITWFSFCYRVTLEDLYNAKTAKLQLSKTVICAKCQG